MELNTIIKLCQKFDRNYDQRCTVREVAILAYLIEHGETAIGEIGLQLMIGQPVVSRYVKKMAKLGFVIKGNGRAIATEKAKEFFYDFK